MSLISSAVPVNTPFLESSPGVPQTTASGVFGKDGPSFKTVLDTVNPLQQLPGVGSVYRAETGDTISPISKIAGGALFGGIFGAAFSAVDAVVEAATGSSIGDKILAAATGPTVPTPVLSQADATELAAATAETTTTANPESAVSEAVAQASPQATSQVASGLPLAQSGAATFVYNRQQAVYENGQGMEALYGQAAKQIKII